MSVFGGFGLQGLSQMQGRYETWGLNQVSASKSWDRWKNAQTRGPTYAKIGLLKAGLNPALAAGGGFATNRIASAPQAAPASNPPPIGSPTMFTQGEVHSTAAALNRARTETEVALAGKYDADTRFRNIETTLAGLKIPEQNAIAEFFKTTQGQKIAGIGRVNAATPQTWPAAFLRLATMAATDPRTEKLLKDALRAAPKSVADVLMLLMGIEYK